MTPNEVLLDAFDRVHESMPDVVSGIGVDDLLWRPDPDANSIAWLVWHLTRVQDDHIAGVAAALHVSGADSQAYTDDGWADRFGLPYPADTVGYGQSSEEVGAFVLRDPGLLTGYHEAVHDRTVSFVRSLPSDAFGAVVDTRWDPPVTASVRLVSVVNDITQHLGQAAYVRGLVDRRRGGSSG